MSLKTFVFSFLLFLMGSVLSCQTPESNHLHTHLETAENWRYCWPTVKDPTQVTAQQLLLQREAACANQWQSIYPPLNPPGRSTPGEAPKQWLWLEVTLPSLGAQDHLYMRGIDEEFAVYMDQEPVYRFGTFEHASHWYQGFPWHMIALQPQHAHEKMYFLVHSKYRHIGIFGSPRIGSKASHLYQMLYMDLDRIVVGGLLIFTGVMVFLLFLRQPIIGYEWLCLFAISIGVYLVVRTEIKQLFWYAPVLTKWIEVISLYIAAPAVTFFLSQIFGDEKTHWWQKLIQLQMGVSLFSLLMAAMQWISIQQTTGTFLGFTLLNMIVGLVIILCRFRQYGRSGWFAMAGILCLCAFTSYDIMASLKWVPWVRPVTHWGVLAVLVSLVFFVKQQVDQLYHAKRLAEESDRMKTSFLANFSHEIRTPLNAIIGFSDLLKKNPQLDKVKEYSAIISDSGKSLLSMINDILDLGKIESNRLELALGTFRITRLGEQIYQLFSLEAQKKKLDWEVHIAEDMPELLRLDGGKLRQILTNLVGNAFKFTEAGKVILSLSYAERGQEGALEIKVRDSGIGMTAEQLERVFQPFYQVEQALHRRFAGTGLGLTISQRLIQLMGGDIRVKSNPGQGTTFSFWLPVTPVRIETPKTGVLSTTARTPAQRQLPEDVLQELQQQLEQLTQQKSIQRIQNYADLLIQKGQQYPESGLSSLGEQLVDAVSQFDIGKINEILHELETLCSTFPAE